MAMSLGKRGLLNLSIRNFIGIAENSLKVQQHNYSPSTVCFASNYEQIKQFYWTNFVKKERIDFNILPVQKFSSKKSSKINHDYTSSSDSEDEAEHHKKPAKKGKQVQRGNSEFWQRKMRALHGLLDINNDGVISFDDFVVLAKKFTDLGHLTPATSEEFMQVMRETWEEQWGEITPYNLVTAEQYLADMHHTLNDRELVKKIGRFLPYFFKAVDTDHSGYLDLEQFKLFFNCLGLTDEHAAISFAVIDKNGDGKLSQKEFVKLGRDYFLTEDDRRVSKWFWGPMSDH